MTMESSTLYFREGSSDKIYQAAIEEAKGGYVVNFAYGRRGSTLQTGSKTSAPVSMEKAKAVFDKLVQSKLAKGYTPGTAGTPYANTANESRDTGIRPQLCNAVAEDEVPGLIGNTEHWLEEKFDGKRILLRKVGNEVTGINRKGLAVGLPQPIIDAASRMAGSFTVDGECVGERLHVFDILSLDGKSVASLPLSKRRALLEKLLKVDGPHLALVQVAKSSAEKARRFLGLKGVNAEGVVFKHQDAPYTAGRPASGGAWLKCKFTTTGSFVVCRVNPGRRSVGLEVYDGRRAVEAGNVTIPPNFEVPMVGTVVESRYLYCNRGGSLFQPVYLGVRDDLTRDDCTIGQLKFKVDADEAQG